MSMRMPSGSGRRLAQLANLALAWALAWALASPSTAAAAEREKLVIGVTAVSGAAGGILAAQDHGLFREQGLDEAQAVALMVGLVMGCRATKASG